MPASVFSQLLRSPPAELERFFAAKFPGVVPDLISPAALHSQFRSNPHLPLISIKCTPYHYGSSCVIVGDAAHAMVPFYGQGMNAGLEDVRILFQILRKHMDDGDGKTGRKGADYDRRLGESEKDDCGQANGALIDCAGGSARVMDEDAAAARARALEEYTAYRSVDAHVINDLALRNYTEMRSSVRSPLYKARKWIEEQLCFYFPRLGWQTQYARVSFTTQRYSHVQQAVAAQSRRLMVVASLIPLSSGMLLILFASCRASLGRSLSSIFQRIRPW